MDKSSAVRTQSSVDSYAGMIQTSPNNNEELIEIQAAVIDAFDAICQSEPALINRFHETFIERSDFPELEESRGCDGMRAVVSSVLWKVVPDEYLTRKPSSNREKLDNRFIDCIRTAIGELASLHPYILRDLRRYKERTGRNYKTIIGGQIAFEIDNKLACPY